MAGGQHTTISTLRRQCIGDLLRRTAARAADRPALVCGATAWTYGELDALADRVAGGLRAYGVTAGSRVAMLSRNSHAFVAMRFAVAKLGAVFVPINFMLTPLEAAFILRHSGASHLCVDAEFAPLAAAAAAHAPVAHRFWLPSRHPTQPSAGCVTFEELATHPPLALEPELSSDSIAQIMYTSGTEASPKGAMLSHDAVITQYFSCLVDLEIGEQDRHLHALPMYHCAQLDVFLGPAILIGAFNVITDKPAADEVLALIEAHAITSLFAPPTVWISLLRSPQFERRDLSALLKGYYGASIMPKETLLELQRRLPALRLWNAYGQTEIAPLATVLKPDDQLRKLGSAGKPCLHVETRVVRDDGTDVMPDGEVGEIVHRSPQLMQGYLNDPERTAAAFAGGWFHSGDLATIDTEGYITVVDRKKDMIKTGGENVSSREVEETIYRLTAVSEVAVFGLTDAKWVESVTAAIVLKSGQSADEAAVLAHCSESLAAYKRPKRVYFVEALPKNASGKSSNANCAHVSAAARARSAGWSKSSIDRRQ